MKTNRKVYGLIMILMILLGKKTEKISNKKGIADK